MIDPQLQSLLTWLLENPSTTDSVTTTKKMITSSRQDTARLNSMPLTMHNSAANHVSVDRMQCHDSIQCHDGSAFIWAKQALHAAP
jgi:hypothetical protein